MEKERLKNNPRKEPKKLRKSQEKNKKNKEILL